MSISTERARRHRENAKAAGYLRASVWISPRVVTAMTDAINNGVFSTKNEALAAAAEAFFVNSRVKPMK